MKNSYRALVFLFFCPYFFFISLFLLLLCCDKNYNINTIKEETKEQLSWIEKGILLENENYNSANQYYRKLVEKSFETPIDNQSDQYWEDCLLKVIAFSYSQFNKRDYQDSLALIFIDTLIKRLDQTSQKQLLINAKLQKAYHTLKGPIGTEIINKIDSIAHLDSVNEAKLLYLKGLHSRGQEKLELLNRASSLIYSNPDQTDLLSYILYEKGISYYSLGNKELSFDAHKKVVEINSGKFGRNYHKLMAYFQLALIPYNNGEYEKAMFQYKKYEELFNKIKVWPDDHIYAGISFSNIGLAYKHVADYDNALLYLDKAIASFKEMNNPRHVASKSMNKATVLQEMGQFRKAIDLNLNIIGTLKNSKDTSNIISTYNNLGGLYNTITKYDSSSYYHQNSLKLKLKLKPKSIKEEKDIQEFIARSYRHLASLNQSLGDYPRAKSYIFKTLDILNEIDLKQGAFVSNVYQKLSEIQFENQEFNEALISIEHAIKTLAPNYNPDKTDLFIQIDSSIVSQSDLIPPLILKAKIHQRLFETTKGDAHIDQANKAFQAASVLIDQLNYRYSSEDSKGILVENYRSFFEEAIQFSVNSLKHSSDSQLSASTIFKYIEKSKNSILNDAISESNAKYGLIPDSLLLEELELKRKINDIKLQINDSTINNKNIDKLIEQRFELEKMSQAFRERLKTNFPKYHKLKFTRTPKIQDIQSYLTNKNASVLEYSLSDSLLVILGITKDSFFIHDQIIDSSFFNSLQNIFRALEIQDPGIYGSSEWKKDFADFCENSQQLYKVLIDPIINQIPTKEIIIVPDRELGYLPFQLLLTNAVNIDDHNTMQYRGLPYLFLDKTICYEYSSTLLIDHKGDQFKNENYLGFGPEYHEEGLNTLKHNKEEVNKVYSLFGNRKYIGQKATKASFLEEAQRAGILHLSMHGILNDQNPLFSRLEFSQVNDNKDDQRLYAYELYNMKLDAQLAVLSACETGLGKLRKGEGIMSLSRAFKYAGCPNIVMTLWSVNDLSSKDIMVEFFKNLKAGKQKNIALEEARRYYLSDLADEKYTHPFYWAPFVLIGDTAPVKIESKIFRWWWLMGLAVIGVGVWYWKKRKKVA